MRPVKPLPGDLFVLTRHSHTYASIKMLSDGFWPHAEAAHLLFVGQSPTFLITTVRDYGSDGGLGNRWKLGLMIHPEGVHWGWI